MNFESQNAQTPSNNVAPITQDMDFGSECQFTQIEGNTIENNSQQYPSQTPKRTINDLFGDIDDMLFEDNLPQPKKLKTDDEKKAKDLALIEQILNMRKINREQNITNRFDDNFIRNYEYDSKYNLSYNVPNYSFIPVTRNDSTRMYVRFHSEQYDKEDREEFIKKLNCKGFMVNSFENIWKEATNYVILYYLYYKYCIKNNFFLLAR